MPEEMKSRAAPPPVEFDAACADLVVPIIAAKAGRLDLNKEDVDRFTRMLWTLGQVPAIANKAQCLDYVRQLDELLTKAGAPMNAEAYAAFLRTRHGALAVALTSRIEDWRAAGGELQLFQERK